jgi:hypothetical protein
MMFLTCSYGRDTVPGMTGDPANAENLRPATANEIAEALSYALPYNSRGKPTHDSREILAKLVSDRLVEHLTMSGFVVLKKPPAPRHSTG